MTNSSGQIGLNSFVSELRRPNAVKIDGAYMGIELEYEQGHPSIFSSNTKYWSIVEDHSLRDIGVEFVSQPLAQEQVRAALKEVNEIIRENGLQSTKRCGVHVHMNVSDLQIKELWNIIMLYVITEPYIFGNFAEGREENHFCVPLMYNTSMRSLLASDINSLRKTIQVLPKPQQPNIISPMTFVDSAIYSGGHRPPVLKIFKSGKYSAVNLQTIQTLRTMEFRHLHGTTSMPKINKWINFLFSFREEALIYEEPSDILLEYISYGVRPFLQKLGLKDTPADPIGGTNILDYAYDVCGREPLHWKQFNWNKEQKICAE